MIIESSKGVFLLKYNYKDAFKLEDFEYLYIDEVFNKYNYIIGDYSDEFLRLKGIKEYNNEVLLDYLDNTCSFEAPFFVLSKSEDDFLKFKENNFQTEHFESKHTLIVEKENFTYDSLVLESNPYRNKCVINNIFKYRKVRLPRLSYDIKDIIFEDKKVNNKRAKGRRKKGVFYARTKRRRKRNFKKT